MRFAVAAALAATTAFADSTPWYYEHMVAEGFMYGASGHTTRLETTNECGTAYGK